MGGITSEHVGVSGLCDLADGVYMLCIGAVGSTGLCWAWCIERADSFDHSGSVEKTLSI